MWHVEAGLRTFKRSSPYQEEFNRQAVGINDKSLSDTLGNKHTRIENNMLNGVKERLGIGCRNTKLD